MQCCGKILQDSFETYKTFPRCIIAEFEHKADVQNYEFGGVRFQNSFFLLVNDDEKYSNNSIVN